jgi:hypothetical protein
VLPKGVIGAAPDTGPCTQFGKEACMKFSPFILASATVLALALAMASCKPLSSPEVISQDCTVAAAPANFTRIFIGTPAHGGSQSGTSAKDPLDGTTAQKFDTILRSIAEGERPTWGTQKNIAPENLIVCLASGTFQTEGQYDTVFQFGYPTAVRRGFTVEKNWKIHGSGMSHTTLQLASFVPDNFVDSKGVPFIGGRNVVLETRSESASGVEVSDLTIDANHDKLSGTAGLPLDLGGIVLRSKEGGHWIHDVKVIGAAGDAGFRSLAYETFAVQIWGNTVDPHVSSGNLIENITVTQPGRPVFTDSPPGGEMDGIVFNNAMGEVRNSVVEGYFIALGGWNIDHVSIHDNIIRETHYGFNADSFSNNNITLQANQFIHPHEYGIIMGGGFPGATFANWNVVGNTITLNATNSSGIGIQGEVQNSTFAGNTIQTDSASAHNMSGLWSFSRVPEAANVNNVFQDNHIDKALAVDFSRDPNFNTNCRNKNRDLQGNVRQDFPDNSSSACR